MPNLLSNLWNKGELPTVHTSVDVDSTALIRAAVTVVIVAAVIILLVRVTKKL